MSSEKRVVKDEPTMRSVMLRSSSSSMDLPPSLARVPAMETFKTPTKGQTLTVKVETSSWKIGTLRELPYMYPLERSNVSVANATPQQVVDRIAECLRNESIAAKFDEAKASLQAETREHVQFAVRLFADHQGQVVVEVQRRSGCSFLFHQCSMSILSAAQGTKRSRSPPKFAIPECVVQSAARKEEDERKCVEDDLDLSISLMKNDRIDSQLIGIESLICLSQAGKFRSFVAHSLLCTKSVQDVLLYLIDGTRAKEDPFCDELIAEHLDVMRRHALTVLANCLEALEESGELVHVLEKNENIRSDDLLEALIAALSTADPRPHDAHQAARCLRALATCCSLTKQRTVEAGVVEAVVAALNVGSYRHALLEGSCRKLQNELGAYQHQYS